MSAPISTSTLWNDVRSRLGSLLSPEVFEMWIGPLSASEEGTDNLVLTAPNDFVAIWIEDNYLALISNHVEEVFERPMSIRMKIAVDSRGESGTSEKEESADCIRLSGTSRTGDRPILNAPPSGSHLAGLNPRNKFENFVVGGGNQLAHAASIAVANAPAKAYNPLFIYGETGLGKTHLMHAVAHHVMATNPRASVAYISTEKFTNKFVRAIRENGLVQFRQRFRKVDVLLIDDVQFLAGREGIQEEFFHTFNDLYESQKQIFIASDRPAAEIAKMESRLVSRFQWGLVTDIQSPDLDTRLAILGKKSRTMGLTLDPDILQFLAEKVTRNIRQMEGALTRISGHIRLINEPLRIDTVERLLQDILQEELQHQVTVEKIQQRVADYFNLRLSELLSRRKPAKIVVPRQISMYLSRMLTNHSLTQIGDAFGGRDHGTVIHAIRTVESLMEQDAQVRNSVEYLTKQLGQRR